MKSDIFPYAGWVQREDGLWAKCKHPLTARQATGGSFDGPQVICVACGLSDSVVFHNKAGDPYRTPPPPTNLQAKEVVTGCPGCGFAATQCQCPQPIEGIDVERLPPLDWAKAQTSKAEGGERRGS